MPFLRQIGLLAAALAVLLRSVGVDLAQSLEKFVVSSRLLDIALCRPIAVMRLAYGLRDVSFTAFDAKFHIC